MNYEILLATSNKHKLEEFRQILCPHGIIVYGISDLNLHPEDVVENGKTYRDNALIKAESLKSLTSFPIIADDSGLEIEELPDILGLYTARFASDMGGHDKAIEYILNALKDKKNRNARFVCDLIVLNIEDKPLLFEGIANGSIAFKKGGFEGFGFDPIFIPEERDECFALLGQKEKNELSHRGKALKKFITYLKIKGLITK